MAVSAPPVLPRMSWPGSDGAVAVLTEDILSVIAGRVADAETTSKAELIRATSLPRSTVSGHVDWLLHRGILARSSDRGPLRRGRPADYIELNGAAGCVIAIEMGVVNTTAAVIDLRGRILTRRRFRLRTSGDPVEALNSLAAVVLDLVDEASSIEPSTAVSSRVAMVAFPARVDVNARSPLRPTVVPTWDGYPVAETLEAALGCPVLLENDCNVRALGEAGFLGADALPLISVQIGTGIGAGIVDSKGEIYHGASGSAGDVGHIPCSAGGETLCSCGSRGCVEAVAAVPAMLSRLEELGLVEEIDDLEGSDLLAAMLRMRHPEVARVVREGAEALGEVVATLCNALNPRRVVITSALAAVSHDVLAGVRSVVYTRARALATKDLVVDYSGLGENVAIAGAYLLGRRHLLSAANIKRLRVASDAPQVS